MVGCSVVRLLGGWVVGCYVVLLLLFNHLTTQRPDNLERGNDALRDFLHVAVAATHARQVVLHDLVAALAEVLPQRLLDAGK
jgi:hypothetical protein